MEINKDTPKKRKRKKKDPDAIVRNNPEYSRWAGMKKRCNNSKHKAYHNYGGRGIKYCERWEKFSNFFEDMGKLPSPEHSLDRIDVNGNYSPENCRWATRSEQHNNTTRNVRLTHNGITLTATQWAKKFNLPQYLIYHRLQYGWSTEKTLETPIGKNSKQKWR